MEVILVRDVPNLGREGERKKVAGGYARNYLILRRLAVPANESESMEDSNATASFIRLLWNGTTERA